MTYNISNNSQNKNLAISYMDIKNFKEIVKTTTFTGRPIVNNTYSKTYLKYVKKINKSAPLFKGDVLYKNKIVKRSTLQDKRFKEFTLKPSVKKQLSSKLIKFQKKIIVKNEPEFTIIPKQNKKFNTTDYQLIIKKKPNRKYSNIEIFKAVDKFLKTIPDKKGNKILGKRVVFNGKSKGFGDIPKSFSTKFMKNLGYDDIKQVNDSSEGQSGLPTGEVDDSEIFIQTNTISTGYGMVKCPKWLENSKCLFVIVNDDNLCGQRCCALSIIKDPTKIQNLQKKTRQGQLEKLGVKMSKNLNIKKEMNILDFDTFAEMYKKQVSIFTGKDVITHTTDDYREDKNDESDLVYIYLDLSINHYHLITNINKFTSKSKSHTFKYCKFCEKSYYTENFKGHKCKGNMCRCCGDNVEHIKDWKNRSDCVCSECNMECSNLECLECHMTNKHKYKYSKKDANDISKNSFKPCNSWKCGECKKWIEKDRYLEKTHKCGEIKCMNCEEYYQQGEDHSCNIMMGNKTAKSTGDDMNYYCYDFESKFDEYNHHIVNLVKVGKMYDNDFSKTFYNIKDFIEWVGSLKNSTFIGHNAKSYDGWLIHHHLNQTFGVKPSNIVLAGQKIMYMVIGTIRFIDSLNFIQSRLSDLPATFGLNTNIIKKGYFPYLMNTDKNKNYIGNFPDIDIFEPNKMKCRKDFDKWYNENKHITDYNFDKELNEYCENDVMILCKSLEVFRDSMKSICEGLDPLTCITIASYAQKVYFTNHSLTEEELDGIENIEREKQQTGISILSKKQYDVMKQGFFGGRTEVFKLYKKWDKKQIEKGVYWKYVDIVSLYPTCQFLDYLPYGKPKHFIFNDDDVVDINDYFGMCRCDITPPTDLLIPLLGGKQKCEDGTTKFQFGLENMVDVVYPTMELQKAIKLGYKITKIYEIFHFKKTKQLFKSYIKNFMRGKIEGAGHKGSQEEKIKYCKEYSDKFDIDIKPENLISNKGKKAVSKLLLNSLWGKFGQRQMKSSEYITDTAKWNKLLKRSEIDEVIIHSRQDLGDSLFIEYEEKEELKTSLKKTNVALCAMITSNARLRLYEELEKLGDRVVYCDTDSIIYEYDKSKYNTTTGKMLGDWEAEGEEDHKMIEFVGIAPKAYSYRLETDEEEIKSKGVSMTIENQKKITFDSYKRLIDNQQSIKTNMMDFNKSSKGITTIHSVKDISFNPNNFKRNIINKYETLPYGYKV